MNRGFYRQTSLIEDEHWWFIHRRRLVSRLLRDAWGRGRAARALDVGCGTGGSLLFLREHCSHVVGLDRSEYALELARARSSGANLLLGDANRLGEQFEESSFDLITVFNLLYHRWIEDDAAVLQQIARLLRPGGLLVLTEPAFPILRRRHDVVDFGIRRYRRKGLAGIVARAGLEVRRATYFNCIAFVPALLRAGSERLSGRLRAAPSVDEEVGEMRLPPPAINRCLLALAFLETVWIRALGRMPLGAGLLLIAHKPDNEPRS
jgi:SAM-dependent methyltransferase